MPKAMRRVTKVRVLITVLSNMGYGESRSKIKSFLAARAFRTNKPNSGSWKLTDPFVRNYSGAPKARC